MTLLYSQNFLDTQESKNYCLINRCITFFVCSEFYPNCTAYYPVLDLSCLTTIWSRVVGCGDDGLGFPGKMDEEQLQTYWGDKNQRSIYVIVTDIDDVTRFRPFQLNNKVFSYDLYAWSYAVSKEILLLAVKFLIQASNRKSVVCFV